MHRCYRAIYYNRKEFCPILVWTELIGSVISIRGNAHLIKKNDIKDSYALMNHLYSFHPKWVITSDRNTVTNWFRSNEIEAKLFSMIVNRKESNSNTSFFSHAHKLLMWAMRSHTFQLIMLFSIRIIFFYTLLPLLYRRGYFSCNLPENISAIKVFICISYFSSDKYWLCTESSSYLRDVLICLYMGLIVCSSSQHTGSSFKV